MKSTIKILLIVLITSVLACKNAPEPIIENGIEYFGEKIEAKDYLAFDELLNALDDKEEIDVKLKARVESVCQAKGCWMNLVPDKPLGKEVFVKFKDYGFFMPKDIAGEEVIVEGKAYRELTSVEELRHYAEDEGLAKEEIAKITEPKEEIKFMASGVALLRE